MDSWWTSAIIGTKRRTRQSRRRTAGARSRCTSTARTRASRARLSGSGDALGGLLALGRALERAVGREAFGDADDLAPEHPKLALDRLVGDLSIRIEDTRCGRDRNDIGHGPGPQRSGGELHRVDRLEPLRAARRADQADDRVVEVRRVTRAEHMQ